MALVAIICAVLANYYWMIVHPLLAFYALRVVACITEASRVAIRTHLL